MYLPTLFDAYAYASPHPRLISCKSGIGPLADHLHAGTQLITLLDLNRGTSQDESSQVKSSPVQSSPVQSSPVKSHENLRGSFNLPGLLVVLLIPAHKFINS